MNRVRGSNQDESTPTGRCIVRGHSTDEARIQNLVGDDPAGFEKRREYPSRGENRVEKGDR